MSSDTLIDLLRHGTPVGGRMYRGKQDDPLSEEGWEQMWHAVSGDTPWSRIISSPLRRCSEFATRLSQQLSLPLSIEPRFQELDYGEWEGKTADELRSQDPDRLKRYFHDPHTHKPPGAEYVEDFMERVGAGFDETIARHGNRHLLIVAHAGVIRALIARALDAPAEAVFRMHVETAHLSRLKLSSERPPTLMFHGRDKL